MLFIQIGNYHINMDKVTDIYYRKSGDVIFSFTTPDGDSFVSITFHDEDAIAFKEAWDRGIAGVVIYKVC